MAAHEKKTLPKRFWTGSQTKYGKKVLLVRDGFPNSKTIEDILENSEHDYDTTDLTSVNEINWKKYDVIMSKGETLDDLFSAVEQSESILEEDKIVALTMDEYDEDSVSADREQNRLLGIVDLGRRRDLDKAIKDGLESAITKVDDSLAKSMNPPGKILILDNHDYHEGIFGHKSLNAKYDLIRIKDFEQVLPYFKKECDLGCLIISLSSEYKITINNNTNQDNEALDSFLATLVPYINNMKKGIISEQPEPRKEGSKRISNIEKILNKYYSKDRSIDTSINGAELAAMMMVSREGNLPIAVLYQDKAEKGAYDSVMKVFEDQFKPLIGSTLVKSVTKNHVKNRVVNYLLTNKPQTGDFETEIRKKIMDKLVAGLIVEAKEHEISHKVTNASKYGTLRNLWGKVVKEYTDDQLDEIVEKNSLLINLKSRWGPSMYTDLIRGIHADATISKFLSNADPIYYVGFDDMVEHVCRALKGETPFFSKEELTLIDEHLKKEYGSARLVNKVKDRKILQKELLYDNIESVVGKKRLQDLRYDVGKHRRDKMRMYLQWSQQAGSAGLKREILVNIMEQKCLTEVSMTNYDVYSASYNDIVNNELLFKIIIKIIDLKKDRKKTEESMKDHIDSVKKEVTRNWVANKLGFSEQRILHVSREREYGDGDLQAIVMEHGSYQNVRDRIKAINKEIWSLTKKHHDYESPNRDFLANLYDIVKKYRETHYHHGYKILKGLIAKKKEVISNIAKKIGNIHGLMPRYVVPDRNNNYAEKMEARASYICDFFDLWGTKDHLEKAKKICKNIIERSAGILENHRKIDDGVSIDGVLENFVIGTKLEKSGVTEIDWGGYKMEAYINDMVNATIRGDNVSYEEAKELCEIYCDTLEYSIEVHNYKVRKRNENPKQFITDQIRSDSRREFKISHYLEQIVTYIENDIEYDNQNAEEYGKYVFRKLNELLDHVSDPKVLQDISKDTGKDRVKKDKHKIGIYLSNLKDIYDSYSETRKPNLQCQDREQRNNILHADYLTAVPDRAFCIAGKEGETLINRYIVKNWEPYDSQLEQLIAIFKHGAHAHHKLGIDYAGTERAKYLREGKLIKKEDMIYLSQQYAKLADMVQEVRSGMK